jgi:hypothetical protein
MAHLSWWTLSILAVVVIGTADDVIRHAAILLPVSAVAVAAAFLIGRRQGQAGTRKAATRSLEAAQRDRLAAELEQLAGRSLDEITESYRVIARRHGGRP